MILLNFGYDFKIKFQFDATKIVNDETKQHLELSFHAHLKPILIFNNFDKLILDNKLNLGAAYEHLLIQLTEINKILSNLFSSDSRKVVATREDYAATIDEVGDANYLFSPNLGNVIFASETDNWSFTLEDFIKILETKLGKNHSGIHRNLLQNVLWGDFYYSKREKWFKPNAKLLNRKSMFVEFILDNILKIYEKVFILNEGNQLNEWELKLDLEQNDYNNLETSKQLIKFMGNWLPFERAILKPISWCSSCYTLMTRDKINKFFAPITYDILTNYFQNNKILIYVINLFDTSIKIARLFTGTIKIGSKLNDPDGNELIVKNLFIFMKNSLELIDEIESNLIFGIEFDKNLNKYPIVLSSDCIT